VRACARIDTLANGADIRHHEHASMSTAASAPSPGPHPRLAYLVSRYPAFSHTFILNEVLRLKALGFQIRVASINDPDRPPSDFTADEAGEARLTYYVKADGPKGALLALGSALVRRPVGTLKGLIFALRLGGADLGKIAFGLFYFIEALMIGRWMRRERLEHLHVHFATPASTVGLIAKQIFPIGFSFMVHGPDEFYDAPGYRLSEKIEGADFVLTIGTYARSQLMKLSPPSSWHKFDVCPLGVDPQRFQPVELREQPDPPEVICVGRLVPAKGQHILVQAIGKLRDAGTEVRLRLVGDGPDRPSLERQVAELDLGDRVIFEGAVNLDRVQALYRGADIFALASFAEGIPIVLMEAMAMEIPCVTTRITGIPELIRDGIDGILVAPSDDDELADAIARLARDAGLRRQLGQAGRARVLDKYDLGRNTERLAATFRRRLGVYASLKRSH
jgi:glycosyltransferase involved in cell wall biosynthesis